MRKIAPILILLSIIISTFSCRKDSIETSESVTLNFSLDTVLFDTVFATFGSTTKRLKIFSVKKRKNKTVFVDSPKRLTKI